ncbi:neuronal acetylcholine receptor subunit alpha-7-like [Folsomia candida]|uniref:neuronal acetylcholine receptor subunit alpha-7-like n=1 Tax=Folsomia candida TaxID=158441 RepID=UPI001604E650|nr:neuronal acetylcholine receptor subunit alpha-7-like [Folsomia candida]
MVYILIFLSLIFGCVIFLPPSSPSPTEGLLINSLLAQYNKLTRPIPSESIVLSVKMGMALLQIIDVNEKQQIITINTWLRLVWHDVNLVWNASEHDNISIVRIPSNLIWMPDILLYNMADEELFQSMHHRGSFINAYIKNDGTVLHVPPMILKSTCKMDVTWFPFDEQVCDIKFGSWTYSGLQMNLSLMENSTQSMDTSGYIPHGEWKLTGIEALRNEKFYECCPEPYVSITFKINIKRQSMYFFFNLIVPCLLIGTN